MNMKEKASPSRVIRALSELTEEDKKALYNRAAWYLSMSDGTDRSQQPEDLIQEAIVSLIDKGRRHWFFRKRSIAKEISRIMRSQAKHSRDHQQQITRHQGVRAAFVDEMPNNEALKILSTTVSDSNNRAPDEILHQQQLAVALEDITERDMPAAEVAIEQLRGLTGPEIQTKLGITAQQYNTIDKRIKSRARRTRQAEDFQ